MSVVAIFVLAVLQGVAEFLPISSSGHLVIVEGLFRQMGTEISQPFTLNIVLHAGTLLSVLVVFWKKIWRLLGADRRVIGLLIVGTIPAAVVGFPLKAYGDHLLNSPLLAGAMLPFTGIMLLWAMRREPGTVDYTEMTYRQALCVGLAQAVALLPGISRSGSTICAGLAVGLKRDAAAAFSFLLAIPAIGGACVLELRHLLKEGAVGPNDPSPLILLSAAAVSFVVGVLALRVLFVALEKGRLRGFAWWCIFAGVATVVWHLTWPPPPPSEQVPRESSKRVEPVLVRHEPGAQAANFSS